MSAEAALKFAAEHGVEFVDVRFTDLLGQWRHLTIPIEEFGLDAFENGVGFDASSLRGWAAINESDMLLIPDMKVTRRVIRWTRWKVLGIPRRSAAVRTGTAITG